MRSPAPAASRGGLGAREQRNLGPPTEIFNAHGKLENNCFGRLCVGTALRDFQSTFFRSDFSGVAPGPGSRGRHRALTDALRTLSAAARDSIGHLLGPWGRGARPTRRTRLLTRHLEEVWFPGRACHALAGSLFGSLFAGKREPPPVAGAKGPSTHRNVGQGAA